MSVSFREQLHALSGELRALASGHWELLRQEMSGKVTHTRQQTLWMAAGALTALTAILLVLAGMTLLLSQVFVSSAGWEPLVAGGISALIIATSFAMIGWLIFRRSGARLKEEGFTPVQTLHSLKTAAQALSNQPIVPIPPPTPMNTRQEFQDAVHQTADTVEYQARRAGRAVQETAHSLSEKFDPGALFATALTWVDAVLTPANRALAGRALKTAAVFPRRHPVVAAAFGVGALYYLWQKSKGSTMRESIEGYAAEKTAACRDFAHETSRSATHGLKTAAAAGRDLRSSLHDTASRLADNGRHVAAQFSSAATATAEAVRDTYDHTRESVSEGVDTLSDTARQLRKDAEASYRKAREFAKEEPALAIAGGVAALALGTLLLVKSSRR